MKVNFVGPFDLAPKQTVSGRALPLAQALSRRGHSVRLVMPCWGRPSASDRCSELQGVQLKYVRSPRLSGPLSHGFIAWRLLWAALADHPDVVHCFKPIGYSGAVAGCVWLTKRLSMARVRLVVDTDDWEGYGGWADRNRPGSVVRRFVAWQERRGLVQCDAVTAASRTLENLAKALGHRGVHYLPNGLHALPALPTRSRARFRLGLDQGPVALVYTRFVEVTPAHLGSILTDLLRRAPDLRVLLVGEGFGDEVEHIRRYLAGRTEGRRVQVTGWVERDELSWYWAAADFALYACEDDLLNRAKSPLRLVEMLGAGLPVVAHGVGTVNEYIEDGISGVVVAPGDDEGFVAAAVRMCEYVDERLEFGRQARERIEHHFLWDSLSARAELAYTL